MPPPPPVITPAPAPKPRKSRGWMIVAVILFVLLAGSLFFNLTQFVVNSLSFKHGLRSETFGTAREVGPKLEECVLENNQFGQQNRRHHRGRHHHQPRARMRPATTWWT